MGRPETPVQGGVLVRKKLAVGVAAGVVALSGFALAGPALAVVGADSAASTVTSRTDKIKDALSGLVTDKTLTQAQADKVADALGSADLGHGFGPGQGGRSGHGLDLEAAATALGVSQDDLRTAVQGGQSLADVAKDKNVSVDTLVSALVAAEKTRIAKEVTDGKLTQAQADERLSDLTTRITERVNSTRPSRGDRSKTKTSPSSSATPSS